MPHSIPARGAVRWIALLGVLGLAWLTTPHPVPLYDGIGFPDQPYRFMPPQPGAQPPTNAETTLKVSGGSNVGGLIINSTEAGPQISLYAPPHAFAAAGTAPIAIAARPVPPSPPLPPGRLDSNVYAFSLTSAAGPVTIVAAAQPPAITMRSVTAVPTLPVFQYRAGPGAKWQELKTRQVGRDIFNTNAPGPGEYVLVQSGAAPKSSSGGHGPLYAVLGATVALVVLVLVGVRIMAGRTPQQ